MKLVNFTLLLCLLLCSSLTYTWAEDPIGPFPRLVPDSVDYPLFKNTPYPVPEGKLRKKGVPHDPYETTFGVRRWLHSAGAERVDFNNTLSASLKWHEKYGGYGVTGHGEDVFTRQSSRWRKSHTGH